MMSKQAIIKSTQKGLPTLHSEENRDKLHIHPARRHERGPTACPELFDCRS